MPHIVLKKKNNCSSTGNLSVKPTFYTPARFGWGKVAIQLKPDVAKVRLLFPILNNI